ncbi:hypothetical protein Aperf_G00000067116 [Anoplocephala perfoliata]
MRYIGKYVKLRDDQFQLSLWGGDAVLNYVELQYDIFEDLMPASIGFKSGHIHELRIQVPWTRLGSSSVVVTLETVECILAFKRPGESHRCRSEATSLPSTDTLTPSDAPPPPSYLQSYLTRIWSNIEVVVNNLIVKFVEDDIVISLNIRSLDCFPTFPNFQRGIENLSPGNYCLHRLLKLSDLTLCIDRCDPKGRINAYQDPVIYRDSFEIRLQTVFTQNNNGLASLCVSNLYNPKLIEINLSQVQVPLIARLLEILAALSKNILRWEVLSDSQVLGKQQETDSKKTEFNVEKVDPDPCQSQSWSQWAWSFVPSIPSFSSNLSDENMYDYDLEESTLKYLDGLKPCEARAEYLKLLYDDALAPSNESAKTSQYRHSQLFHLRKYQKPIPALVLGVFMAKIQVNIKAHRSGSIPNQSSSSKNLRRNELHDIFTATIENLGFQCVQDAGHFASVHCGVGSLKISPAGEICSCGKKNSLLALSPDLLNIRPEITLTEDGENMDALLKTFCGLFRNVDWNSSSASEEQEADVTKAIVTSQPTWVNSFILPPFCRKDFLSTYGSHYHQNRLSLGSWFESVSSIEDNNEAIDESYDNPRGHMQYSFGRFLLDTVKINFTLSLSHRMQHFLRILADGSKHYKPCADWSSLDVLPLQEPVESWILQERMVHLGLFTPLSINRGQVLSLCIEVFPPSHDHSVDHLASLKIETNSIETFDSAPLDRVQLVSTMTHLYPSSSEVISDVNASFCKDLLCENPLECKNWGRQDQISACFGVFHQNPDDDDFVARTNGVLFGLGEENPITRPLQIDLLNECYIRQLIRISNLRVTLGQQPTPLMSPLSITMIQRNLLFAESWPQHLANGLVIQERSLKLHSQICLNLNAFAVCNLSVYGFFLTSSGSVIADLLSHYLHNEACTEDDGFSAQLSETGLESFFKPPINEKSHCLRFDAKGSISLYSQSGKSKNVMNVTLETPYFSGNLITPMQEVIAPIFERSAGNPSTMLSFQLEKTIVSRLDDILHPSSVVLKMESVNFILTLTLVEWLGEVTSALKSSWEAFEEVTSDESYMETKSSISFQKLGLHKRTSSDAKLCGQSLSNRPNESFYVVVTEPDKPPEPGAQSVQTFSEWIIANYKWFTSCKLEILISSSTIYMCPLKDHFSTGDYNAWLASFSSQNRASVVRISLPRIEITGPSSHCLPVSRGNAAPPSVPSSATTEFAGIRLYSFELEEQQAEEAERRFRRMQSNPELGTQKTLDPNQPKWDCKTSGGDISVGMSPSPLFKFVNVESSLAFTVSSPKLGADPSSIDWNLSVEFTQERKKIGFLANKVGITWSLISSRTQKTGMFHNSSNISTLVEVMPCGSDVFGSPSLISHVTHTSSSHSRLRSMKTPVCPSPVELPAVNSQISIYGRVQVTISSSIGQLYLDDGASAVRWEIEGLSSTVSISHSTNIHFLTQLERACLLLHTRERCYPLLSPKYWHLRQFQNVTPCPGTECLDGSKLGQSRPKPKSPQSDDIGNYIYSSPFRHSKPTPIFTISIFRCSAGLLRRAFAGKRFTRWLDWESEQLLQGDNCLESCDATPPFVNCIYIRLKPLDAVLCPQLLSHIKDAFGECGNLTRVTPKYEEGSSKANAPLPGHCLPLVFAAVDELRLFVPSPGLLNPLSEDATLIDTITFTMSAMHLHPFPTYSITRLSEAGSTTATNLKTTIGSPLEDRQYILSLDGLACWAVKLFDALNCSESVHRFDYGPTLAGQYPAFEWNQAATRLNDLKDAVWVLPVLRPLDVTAIYAAPVCDKSFVYGQSRLLLGSALEVNINHDIIVTFCTSFLANYLSNLFEMFGSTSRAQPMQTKQTLNQSCPPSRILFTCGLMRCVAWERRISVENCWDFSVVEVIQAHLIWLPRESLNMGLNDIRIYLRTSCDGTNSEIQNGVVWNLSPPKSAVRQSVAPSRLLLPQIEAELSRLYTSDGVCFFTSGDDELVLITFSRQNSRDDLFEATVRIQRNITLAFTPAMLTCLTTLSKPFQSIGSSMEEKPEDVDCLIFAVWMVNTLSRVHFDTRSISACLVTPEDKINFSIENIRLEGSATQREDWRSFDTALEVADIRASLNNFQCIPSGTELSLRSSIEISSANTPIITANLAMSRGSRVILPLGTELKRLTEAFACIEVHNSTTRKKAPRRECVEKGVPYKCSSECQIFSDDLRQKSLYNFSVFVPTESSGLGDTSRWLPLPFEVVFADCDQFAPEGIKEEERCVTMTWTFPEPRQIIRLTLNPVPLVYENDDFKIGDIKLPARLQYWNEYVGEYGGFMTYASFELREDAPVDVQLPSENHQDPRTFEQFNRHRIVYRSSGSEKEDIFWGSKAGINFTTSTLPVAAITWRIIVSCIGRYTSKEKSAEPLPVFLPPYALAACTHLDSAFVPELSRPFTIQFQLDDFCISAWKITKQTSLETGRLNVSKFRGLLANTSQQNLTLQWSFSLDSAAVHVFSPHTMHLQTLCQVEGVFGVSGASFSMASCYLRCSSTLIYSLRHLLKEDGTYGWLIRNRTDSQLCVEQWFSGIQPNEPSAEALVDVTRFLLAAGECRFSWRPIVLPTGNSRNQVISLRVKKSTVWSSPLTIVWPPVHSNRTVTYPIQWISSTEKEGTFYPLFLLIPTRSSSGTPGEIIIQSGLLVENNLPIKISITLPGGSISYIEPSSSQGLCVPSSNFDLALSASSSSRTAKIAWDDLITSKQKIILLPIGEDVTAVLFRVNPSISCGRSDSIRSITLAPALRVTSEFPMLLTLEISANSTAHFLTSPEGNFSESMSIPQGSTTNIAVAFRLESKPTFNFLYLNRSPVFESPLSVPLETASNRIDVFVQPWLVLTNRSGISLQVFAADSLEGINYPGDSALKLDTGSSFIPGAGERLLRVGLHHKGEVVWSPPLLVHNSVFSPPTDSSSNSINDGTVIILTASGSPPTSRRKSIEQTPAGSVVSLTRTQPFTPISLRLNGLVCALAVQLHVSEWSYRGGAVVTLSISPLLHLKNRSSRALLCKPIVAPDIDIQQPLPVTADVDELNAEVVSLPASGGETSTVPLLFWNFTHPNAVFEGVDSNGILFAHLLVLRSCLGVFWNGDPNECSLLLTLSNESPSGIWTLYLDNLSMSLSASLGCSLTNALDFSIEASINCPEFHKLPVSNALPCVYSNGGKLVIIPQFALDHLFGMQASGKTPKSDFPTLERASLHLRLNFDEVIVKLTECAGEPLSLSVGGKTFLIQQVVNPAVPCSINIVFFDKKPSPHLSIPVSRPLSLSICIDTILIVAPIYGSLLKQDDSGLRNFIQVSIRCIECAYSKHESLPISEFNVTSSLIQVDNLAQLSLPTFDFPVLLRSVLSHAVGENSTGRFSCSGKIQHISNDFILDKFDLCLPSIEVYLEDSILYAIFYWFEDLRKAWTKQVEEEAINDQLPAVLCLRDLHIHSVALQLSLKAKVGVHISCKTTQFHLNNFTSSDAALQVSTLLARMSTHYISQILIRAGIVLGSLELIGNPVSLVASLAEGISDLVHFADREKVASREQLGPLRGLARGLMSLVKHTTGGVCNSITGIASSVARNLHELSMDTEHIQRITETRQRHRPTGLGNGLVLGLSEFGVALLGGLAGVAHHPLFALIDSSTSQLPSVSADMSDSDSTSPPSLVTAAEAFVGGVGRGLVGLMAKPLAGVADLVAFTGTGFMHGMGAGWGITPSPSHISCPILPPDALQLVDISLLHRWSCALMRHLDLPQFHEYLWNGLGTDTAHTALTWLCLPYPGSLFAVEFKASVQTIDTGMIPINFANANGEEEWEDVLLKSASNSDISNSLTQCRLSIGDKAALKRVLQCFGTEEIVCGIDVDSAVVEASPHLQRIRAYLMSLPRSGDGDRTNDFGIGFLLPWNVFINAKDYFVDYKLNTTISENADYRINFLSYIGIASQLPSFLLAAFNTFYQLKSSASNPTVRFMVIMVVELLILIFTTVMVFVDTSNTPGLFFSLTISSAVLINCCVGVHQTLTYGLAAYLPMTYSNAVVIGSNVCGVLVASMNMLVKGLAEIWGKNERGIIITRTCYFAAATIYVLVCIVAYVVLQRLDFVRYYLDRKTSKPENEMEIYPTHEGDAKTTKILENDDVGVPDATCSVRDFIESEMVDEGNNSKENEVDDTSSWETLRNCFALCCFLGAEGRWRCRKYWWRYKETFKECWLQCVTVWMVFTCTLSLFPSVQSTIRPFSPDYFIPESWFVDITCFFFFNLFALLGCVVTTWVRFPGPRFLWLPVLIRFVFFVPFFLLSNYRIDGQVSDRRMPLWMENDHVYVIGSIIFAFTSGYFSSLAMMYAPKRTPPERAGLAGLLASFFLIAGVFSGCNLTRLIMAFL